MKFSQLIAALYLILIISACSSSKGTVKNDNLSISKIINSNTSSSNLIISIPSKWREIKDNYNQLFDVWLVNKKNNAVIAFIPINFSENLLELSNPEKMEIIEQIIINKKKSSLDDFEIVDQQKELTKYEKSTLKYRCDGNIHNSVIFGKGNNYYECVAYFKNDYTPSSVEIYGLIKTQNLIIDNSKLK